LYIVALVFTLKIVADIAVGRLPGKVASLRVASWTIPSRTYLLKSVHILMSDIERIVNRDICLSDVGITERVNQLIVAMGISEGDRKVLIYDTNFYSKLRQSCLLGDTAVMSMANTWHKHVHPLDYTSWAFFIHVPGVDHWSLAILLRPGAPNTVLHHIDTLPGLVGHDASEISNFTTSYMRALQRRDMVDSTPNARVANW
jgi:hypothetical protein